MFGVTIQSGKRNPRVKSHNQSVACTYRHKIEKSRQGVTAATGSPYVISKLPLLCTVGYRIDIKEEY